MLRYAVCALFVTSLASIVLGEGPNAASDGANGNIGCLFSHTLCSQDKEWCFNDVAFGKCLPLYGSLRDTDMRRYKFEATELHVLEREMQRLFLLGYRWSHSYTQCVLQSILDSIKNKSETDITRCNVELDQDLEGALKAIEGEERDHVDPRNLAIVRFTPSVADPHSNFADEFYYPPVEEMLPPFRGKTGNKEENGNAGEGEGERDQGKEAQGNKVEEGKQEQSNKVEQEDNPPPEKLTTPPVVMPSREEQEQLEVEDEMDQDTDRDLPFDSFREQILLEDLPYLPGPDDEYRDDEEEDDDVYIPEDVYQERMALFPPAIPMSMYLDGEGEDSMPYEISEKNYNYDLLFHSPYASRPNMGQMFKRNGLGPDPNDNQQVFRGSANANGFRNTAPINIRQRTLRELAVMLKSIRPLERPPGFGMNLPPINDYPPSGGSYLPPPSPQDQDQPFGGPNGRPFVVGDIGYFQKDPYPSQWRDNDIADAKKVHVGEISYYPPYDGLYYRRGPFPPPETQLPEIQPPKPQDPPATLLHPPYIKSDYVKEETKPNSVENNNNKNKDNIQKSHFDNSVSRFDNEGNPIYESFDRVEDRTQPQWMSDGAAYPPSQSFKDPQHTLQPQNPFGGQHGIGPMAPRLPIDSYYGRPYYPAYGLSAYDDGRDYYNYDYGGAPDYPHGPPFPPGWNLPPRDERLDVKKPGPFFRSANEFGFDDYRTPENEEDWMAQMGPKEGKAVLLTKLRQSQGLNEDGTKFHQGPVHSQLQQDQVPDLLLTEEGFVEDASDESRRRGGGGGQKGFPKAAQMWPGLVSLKGGSTTGEHHHSKGQPREPDSYVYISIKGRFESATEAEQMVYLILHLSGLDMKHIQQFSYANNQVMFQLRENSKGMTAAHLAERTEELRDDIKEKIGMEIIQAGVGTKTSISAVVFSSNDNRMIYAAAVVCAVCATLLVVATVLFFVRRHLRSKVKFQGVTEHDTEASKVYEELVRDIRTRIGECKDPLSSGPGHAHPAGSVTSGHAPGQRISSLSKESDNGNNSPSSRSSTSSWSEEPVISNMDISTGHMVLSYMEDHLRNKDRLEQEWVALCAYEAEPCASNLALKPENAQKNRYHDILPYDHIRVILNEHTNASGSSYINASSITDHDPRNPAYIATQGPLAATAADFWQLVWEQGCVVIVMLTRLTENGQALCHRYWPEEGSDLYHIYEVNLVSEHIWCDDYLVRSFFLKNVRSGETRTVTQFHFLSWPESGIPASTKALLEFRRKVNKSYRGRSCPIIVHCSDGIGRTGTYCLIDMVLNRMSKGAKEIDIAATLEHIRDQRPNMVKTKVQFEFVLMSVAEEVHAILKALPQ